MTEIKVIVALLTVLAPAFACGGEPLHCDVAIYGATPGGISAALAAADENIDVLLIEPTNRIGGLTTHGLSHSDFHSFESLSGAFLKFSQRVRSHYVKHYGEESDQVRDSWQGTHGEPSVNRLVFHEMLAEKPTIRILKRHRLTSTKIDAQAIQELRFETSSGETVVVPEMVIDATYEGDLLAAAGVPFRVGREARSEYGESLAPLKSDRQLQGYNYRLCMTQDEPNRIAIPVPDDYRREDYVAVVPLIKAGKFKAAFGYPGRPFILKAHLPALPNRKHDINDVSKGLVRLSLPGHNVDYPEGDLATRRKIEQEHLNWQLGLIHFLQTDAAVPEPFRSEAATWGLCRDEFQESGYLPPQIYVREARRMVGQYVYTEADTEYAQGDSRGKLHRDAIAVGEYSHNCHGTGHEGPRIGGTHRGEFYKAVAPYQIPYGVIVPKQLRNLLVPVACSASHVGFCALRLEPIWMSLGTAAGEASVLSLQHGVAVQEVGVSELQERIWKGGGATVYVSDVSPGQPDFIAVQRLGSAGALHGLEPGTKKMRSRGKHLTSQYYEAYRGHELKREEPLSDQLRQRWTRLAEELGLQVSSGAKTRGEFIAGLRPN
ncbi:FAD-dependent oxidoreductase [Roseiconus lacunae]|uniref:FAD-dependent oxidoreductase n=1 Tax=Roseiconus lacunae TaxID=2605694 RepID=A0ABT7PRD8_9BACT|nr:FAD-dependent oxidoreductase [Roseiconus lacunae]MDM4018893.1 FAD-dependent oxidoreductase [Roseiconus lacunae]